MHFSIAFLNAKAFLKSGFVALGQYSVLIHFSCTNLNSQYMVEPLPQTISILNEYIDVEGELNRVARA